MWYLDPRWQDQSVDTLQYLILENMQILYLHVYCFLIFGADDKPIDNEVEECAWFPED